MVSGRWPWLSPACVAFAFACGGAPCSAERSEAPRAPHAEVADVAHDEPKTHALVLEVDGVALKDVKGWYRMAGARSGTT